MPLHQLVTCLLSGHQQFVSTLGGASSTVVRIPTKTVSPPLPPTLINGFRCYEAKIEESEKAGSRQELNPGHLA